MRISQLEMIRVRLLFELLDFEDCVSYTLGSSSLHFGEQYHSQSGSLNNYAEKTCLHSCASLPYDDLICQVSSA